MRVIDYEYGANFNPISVTCEDNGKEYEFKVICHAKWEPDPDSPPRHRCSNCHSNPYDNEADQILFRADFKEYLTKYCCDCGCKMDLDDDFV